MDRGNSEPVPADFGETFSTGGDSRAPAVRRGGRVALKLPPIDWPAIDKFDLRVVPLRGNGDNLDRLRRSLYAQTTRHSFIDNEPRDFGLLAAPDDHASVIVRVQ